ncbi:hypothetical protein QN277_026375 [Acacia crassicarpa]|uniref:Protein kinase domain-containing protein n=1 Tax=Acacia crassicarpa TaxID=499986 RepID=A0AAE1JAP7_9FABA|nr:hypothetical protein QN277_026375 [Acacia crassicarpa]
MAFDQNSVPKDLRPLNVARTDEPLIVPANTMAREIGSPGTMSIFYPPPVADAGLVGVGYGTMSSGPASWCVRPGVSIVHTALNPPVGYSCSPSYGNRISGGNAVDLSSSVVANGPGYAAIPGNWAGGNGLDRAGNDAVNGFGCTSVQGNRILGNATAGDQVGSTAATGFGNSPAQSNVADLASDEGGDDSVSGRKVKFLCSYGGKIMPRPSDGMLRYVGGQTRIIGVKRDVSFNELMQKMVNTYGQPVVIKYQLPEEDLDALVSVSCPDDLENMMDEYERLIERSSDGSAKLRIFLFSASEIDPPGGVPLVDINDSGLRYVEAVNGIADGVSCRLMRKGSITSAASTQNSDVSVTEALDSSNAGPADVSVGPSSCMFSPRDNLAAAHDTAAKLAVADQSPRVYSDASAVPVVAPVATSGPAQTTAFQNEVELEKSVPFTLQQQQFGVLQSGMDISTPAPYVHPFVDSRPEVMNHADYVPLPPQAGFPSSQLLAKHGPAFSQPQFQDNIPSFVPQQFIPAVPMTMTPSASHVSVRPNVPQTLMQSHQTRLDQYNDESTSGPKIIQLPVEQNYSAYPVQVPSVVPGNYGWVQVPQQENVILSDGLLPQQQVRIPGKFQKEEDCYMCQKLLPHAHSDPVVPDQRDTVASSISDSILSYYSLPMDENLQAQATNRVMVTAPLKDGAIEQGIDTKSRVVSKVESPVGIPCTNAAGLSYKLESQPEGEKNVILKPDAFDHLRSPIITDVIGKAGDSQSPIDGFMGTATLSCLDDVGQQTMPLENWVKQDVLLNKPVYSDATPAQESPNEHTNEFVNLVSQPVECNLMAQTPVWDIPGSNSQSTSGNLLKDDNLPSLISPSVRSGDVQNSSNSLFSNQDPWNAHHSTYFPPPRPKKVPSKKEIHSSKDHFGEELTSDSGEQNLEAQLEDSLYQPFKKSLYIEHGYSAQGSAEDQIKQDLQAVAEGVAASVLHPSTPSPDLHGRDVSSQEDVGDADDLNRAKAADVKSKLPEKPNFGIPLSEGLGGLQIIKNCDLEELRELGSGTFGTVYHGKWRGTDVAIKRINDRCFAGKASEQERMRADFWNEAIKLADLHHPNVVAFYGVVLDGPGGSVATVTEFMVNGSLRNALQKSERNLDKRKRVLIALDVAFGMEYLHGKNIVHFDLKSDNLLVNLRDPHRPICKVGDLGLSKVKCQTLISGGVRGTLPWMAPELLNGSSSLVSEKVDVFSFGIVMWEILTGEEPYADLHYGAIIGGIVSNTLRPPIPDSYDPDWKLLMERCWSSEPSERPSFTEIANELRSMASKIPPKGQAQQQQPSVLQAQAPK